MRLKGILVLQLQDNRRLRWCSSRCRVDVVDEITIDVVIVVQFRRRHDFSTSSKAFYSIFKAFDVAFAPVHHVGRTKVIKSITQMISLHKLIVNRVELHYTKKT